MFDQVERGSPHSERKRLETAAALDGVRRLRRAWQPPLTRARKAEPGGARARCRLRPLQAPGSGGPWPERASPACSLIGTSTERERSLSGQQLGEEKQQENAKCSKNYAGKKRVSQTVGKT